MKKTSLLLTILSITILLLGSCEKVKELLSGKMEIRYSCTNNSGQTASISYINVNGENEFEDVGPHVTWSKNLDFNKGDWVRLQAQCGASTGILTVSISCYGCGNIGTDSEKLSESVNLSVRNIVEVSATIE